MSLNIRLNMKYQYKNKFTYEYTGLNHPKPSFTSLTSRQIWIYRCSSHANIFTAGIMNPKLGSKIRRIKRLEILVET